MTRTSLSLIVLRSAQIKASLAFYRALGFTFEEEKHGNGPVHYAAQTGSLVLELYPGEAAPPLSLRAQGATMLGFTVPAVDPLVAAVRKLGAQIVTAPGDSPLGRRAVVVDPDGRAVELSEPKASYKLKFD